MIKDFDDALKIAKKTEEHKISRLLESLPLTIRAQVADHLIATKRYSAKISSWINNNCEIELVAAEPASPEPVALARFNKLSGRTAIDLTAGLGMDTYALSRKFNRVIALERDADRAKRLKRNMDRIGATNVWVINTASEQYLKECKLDEIDFIFVDPDRRARGNKRSDWMAAEPRLDTILNLIPHSIPVWVKQSPAFHWREACVYFPQLKEIEASSWKNETKEIVWKFNEQETNAGQLNLRARNILNNVAFEFMCAKEMMLNPNKVNEINNNNNQQGLKYIIIPANSILSINVEQEWINSLGIECWSTGPHGWFLTDQKFESGLGQACELTAWNIGRLSELGRWLKKNNWRPNTISKRGIQAKLEQIIAKWNLETGERRDLWLGASGTGQYFLGVGR